MGDVLHAMPAVAALRQLHPDWHIGWAVEPRWMPLLRAESKGDAVEPGSAAMPLVDRLHAVSTRAWKRRPFSRETLLDINALRRELRAAQYDLCVDMQGTIRSSVIGRMAGAKQFAGPADPRERPAGWMYGKQIQLLAAHVVEQGCELLGTATGQTLTPADALLPLDESAERWRDDLFSRIQLAGPFVVIAPTAGWGAKQWPAERYGAVAAELARAGYTTLVNASSPDNALANAVVQASEGSAIVAPCTVARLIALLRRASLMIAGDTGPLHLAAALGRPVVGLYGPTDPARNGPYGTRSRVLRHASSHKDHTRHSETEQGLMQITTDEVTEAALELLRAERDKVV